MYNISGLSVDCHGGGCCGMSHLYNFPDSRDDSRVKALTDDQKVIWIKDAVASADVFEYEDCGDSNCETCADDLKKIHTFHHCIEVVLNKYQLVDWEKPLELSGFKKVFSFRNDNTSNECHIFMLETGYEPLVKAEPEKAKAKRTRVRAGSRYDVLKGGR